MKNIILNINEYNYLSSSEFLPPKLLQLLLNSSQNKAGHWLLIIPEEKVDDFRDLFIGQLQVKGFDENYRLTREGEILESLIDKFFLG